MNEEINVSKQKMPLIGKITLGAALAILAGYIGLAVAVLHGDRKKNRAK